LDWAIFWTILWQVVIFVNVAWWLILPWVVFFGVGIPGLVGGFFRRPQSTGTLVYSGASE
jgi:hypothetical protein